MQKRSSIEPNNVLANPTVDNANMKNLLEKAINSGKNPAAVILGRLGGLKGGKARAVKLSPEMRSQIAKKAAEVRWKKEG